MTVFICRGWRLGVVVGPSGSPVDKGLGPLAPRSSKVLVEQVAHAVLVFFRGHGMPHGFHGRLSGVRGSQGRKATSWDLIEPKGMFDLLFWALQGLGI